MRSRYSVALAVAVALGVMVLGSGARAITMGSLTTDYPEVGVPFGGFTSGTGTFGTGTLIADRWVLTAAHVVNAILDTPNPSFRLDGTDTSVANGYVHPSFDLSTGLPFDIGLLELQSAIPGHAMPTLYDGSLSVGQLVNLVGFGASDPGSLADGGVLREGFNTIFSVSATQFTLVSIGSLTLAGDSGGPAWADFGGGEVIVGIHSFGNPGSFSVDVQVAPFRSFIDGIVGEGVVKWGREPVVATAVPEPLPLTTFALGLAGLGLLRRRTA